VPPVENWIVQPKENLDQKLVWINQKLLLRLPQNKGKIIRENQDKCQDPTHKMKFRNLKIIYSLKNN